MKKKIKIQYNCVFKYDDHKETMKFSSRGTYINDDKSERFVFFYEGTKMEIIIKGNEVILYNGPSVLQLQYHRKINNLYQTQYGMINLNTELVTFEHNQSVKLKYILSDGNQKISEVYVILTYREIEE